MERVWVVRGARCRLGFRRWTRRRRRSWRDEWRPGDAAGNVLASAVAAAAELEVEAGGSGGGESVAVVGGGGNDGGLTLLESGAVPLPRTKCDCSRPPCGTHHLQLARMVVDAEDEEEEAARSDFVGGLVQSLALRHLQAAVKHTQQRRWRRGQSSSSSSSFLQQQQQQQQQQAPRRGVLSGRDATAAALGFLLSLPAPVAHGRAVFDRVLEEALKETQTPFTAQPPPLLSPSSAANSSGVASSGAAAYLDRIIGAPSSSEAGDGVGGAAGTEWRS